LTDQQDSCWIGQKGRAAVAWQDASTYDWWSTPTPNVSQHVTPKGQRKYTVQGRSSIASGTEIIRMQLLLKFLCSIKKMIKGLTSRGRMRNVYMSVVLLMI